jgi:hypothetical protein
MRTATVGLGLLLATGLCSPTQPAAVNHDLVLAPGQAAEVPSASLRVRLDSVVSDSRCPADVTCIRAGDAVVQIFVSGHGGPADYQLHTTDPPRSVRHGDLTIALLQLLPQPISTRAIEAHEYRATLRVSREN